MKSFENYEDLHENLSTLWRKNSSSKSHDEDEKLMLFIELLAVFYIIGIIGSFSALLHLYRKKNFKNTKQAFMLKCLMTLEFVGLVGMLTQMIIRITTKEYKSHIQLFCFLRILWRFFGLSSGCVAFLMAIERYFALTKPFWYCKHFTNGLMYRLIFILWSLAGILTFLPVVGIGIYCDVDKKMCARYRDATKPMDKVYAYLFFFVGSMLCIFMVLCNASVTRIVYASYRNMKQLTQSSLENFNRIQAIKFRHQLSEVSSCSSTTTKSISLITRDEIEFINMVNLLTGSFVVCWGTSMITIPIAQFVETANHSVAGKIFFHIADMLLLLHFTFDPYIYVIMRTDYWKKIKNFFVDLFRSKEHEDELAEMF